MLVWIKKTNWSIPNITTFHWMFSDSCISIIIFIPKYYVILSRCVCKQISKVTAVKSTQNSMTLGEKNLFNEMNLTIGHCSSSSFRCMVSSSHILVNPPECMHPLRFWHNLPRRNSRQRNWVTKLDNSDRFQYYRIVDNQTCNPIFRCCHNLSPVCWS